MFGCVIGVDIGIVDQFCCVGYIDDVVLVCSQYVWQCGLYVVEGVCEVDGQYCLLQCGIGVFEFLVVGLVCVVDQYLYGVEGCFGLCEGLVY